MEKWINEANWIFVKDPAGEAHDKYYDYQTVFCVETAKQVTVHISAHSNYALWVNGQFADCGQLPDYESRQIYDTLDISHLVKEGENLLEITQYVAGKAFSTGRPAIPAVIFAVEADGVTVKVSDTSVLSGHNSRYASLKEEISGQCGYNCAYDANGEDTVFENSVLAEKPKNLIARPIRKVVIGERMIPELKTQGAFLDKKPQAVKSHRMMNAYLSYVPRQELIGNHQPVSLWAGQTMPNCDYQWQIPQGVEADGAYFLFDLGNEYAGFLDLELETEEPAQVFISYGEHLDRMRVMSYLGNRHFCFGFQAKPGKNRFFHPLQRIAGRYLQVHIYGKKGMLHYAGIRPADYPLTRQPVPVKDGLNKWIWEVSCKTLELCMHEHYEDCPWREQALYTMDSRTQMLCGYYAFGEYPFPRESLRTIMESLRPDGLLELCAPGLVGLNIPGYTAIFPRQVWEYTQYSGDRTLIAECFEGLTRIVEKLRERIDETGLFSGHQGHEYWHFYEWRPGMHTMGITEPGFYEAPMQALVADAFCHYGKICEILGKEGAQWRQIGETLLQNAHKAFFDEKTGAYKTRPEDARPTHELTQALMLWAGGVPEENKASVEQAILGEKLIRTSLSMTVFTYEALLQNPANRAYVLSEIHRIWGKMLSAGAQTFWETEEAGKDFGGAGSLCHGWSAVPVYLFAKYDLENESWIAVF